MIINFEFLGSFYGRLVTLRLEIFDVKQNLLEMFLFYVARYYFGPMHRPTTIVYSLGMSLLAANSQIRLFPFKVKQSSVTSLLICIPFGSFLLA
jgi:hypothetical protein